MHIKWVIVVSSWIAIAQAATINQPANHRICYSPRGNYFIPPGLATAVAAPMLCQSFHGHLAVVDQENLGTLTRFVSQCLGPTKRARIQVRDPRLQDATNLAIDRNTIYTVRDNSLLFVMCETNGENTNQQAPVQLENNSTQVVKPQYNPKRIQLPEENWKQYEYDDEDSTDNFGQEDFLFRDEQF